jgi:hypothetical protein
LINHRLLAFAGALDAAIALSFLLSGTAIAQSSPKGARSTKAAPSKAWSPRHTPDGQADIQGVWMYSTLTPLERPPELAGKAIFTEAEAATYAKEAAARVSTDRRDGGGTADVGRSYNEFWRDRGTVKAGPTSLIIDPADGKLPAMTPEGKRLEDARNAARNGPPTGPEDRNLWERCLTRGLPMYPSSYNNNFQIVQSAGTVLMIIEMIHDARIIPLDGRPHLPSGIRSWLGDSRGHWDGNTLVVDTTNFNNVVSFRGSTDGLHLTEKFTRSDLETLLYEFTMDDPKAFTKPWTAVISTTKTTGAIYEYACHEGNYALADILAGAREEEKRAASNNGKRGGR